MHDESTPDSRRQSDRRRRPTSPLDALRWRGRRVGPRREVERQDGYFVDRFDAGILAMVVTLLALTIADGVLTLELVDINSEEANPIMALLLDRGVVTFLLGKYIMTAAGIPFLVVYKNYPLFRTRFRAGWLLPAFIALYLVLLFHQWTLFRMGRPVGTRNRTHATVRWWLIGHDDDASRRARAALADPGVVPRELPQCLRLPDSAPDECPAAAITMPTMRFLHPGS
jgi:hypothetical protein